MSAEPQPETAPAAHQPGGGQGFPAIDRHRLGAELKQLREARALRLEDVAACLDLAPSTVSRIETGKAPTRTSYLAAMLDLYGVTDPAHRRTLTNLAREGQRKDWWTPFRDLLPAGAGAYLGFEAAASEIRGFSVLTVPSLLQTTDYAAALLTITRPDLSDENRCELAELQRQRQEQLSRSRQRLHIVVDESVLLRTIGTPAVTASQLRHLLTVTTYPRITLQVAPLATTAPAISPSFTVLSFADPADSDVGCCSGPGGRAILARRTDDLRTLRSAFDALSHSALSPDRSAYLIQQAVTRWQEPDGHDR
jgi:transcriptional regulator with XRE-family HTH domain